MWSSLWCVRKSLVYRRCLWVTQRNFHKFGVVFNNEKNPAEVVEKNESNENDEDFFGFSGKGVKDVFGETINELELFSKYEELLRKPETDKVFITNYGKIRFDADNPSKEYGNKSEGIAVEGRKFDEVKEVKDNYFDELCFGNQLDKHQFKIGEVKKKTEDFADELSFGSQLNKHKFVVEEDGKSNQKLDLDTQSNYTDEAYFESQLDKHLFQVDVEEREIVEKDVHQENYIDEQYFGTLSDNLESNGDKNEEKLTNQKMSKSDLIGKDANYFDEIYYGSLQQKSSHDVIPKNVEIERNVERQANDRGQTEKKITSKETIKGNINSSDLTDHQINKQLSKNIGNMMANLSFNEEAEIISDIEKARKLRKFSIDVTAQDNLDDASLSGDIEQKLLIKKKTNTKEKLIKERDIKNEATKNKKQTVSKETATINSSSRITTANDYLEKKQEKLLIQDMSAGRVIPQVIDLEKEPDFVVLNILKKNILYNKDDIVAINKPYGMACQPGQKRFCILQRYLSELARFIDRDLKTLYPVHRLDAGTTGVLLLAKTEQMADIIKNLLQTRKLLKNYWVITKGVPDPPRGLINIPIAEGKVGNRRRMVLSPDFNQETKLLLKNSSLPSREAMTEYNVLSESGSAALVELETRTGITHQIRVHLGFGLGCPILGDHKYSFVTRLAPQKLPREMLLRLNVRQSKVRDLPLHLHARSVLLPELMGGKNVFIKADLPQHFRWAMQRLKLSRQK